MEHAAKTFTLVLAIVICLLIVLRRVRSRRETDRKRATEEQEWIKKTTTKLNELVPDVLRLCDEISRVSQGPRHAHPQGHGAGV